MFTLCSHYVTYNNLKLLNFFLRRFLDFWQYRVVFEVHNLLIVLNNRSNWTIPLVYTIGLYHWIKPLDHTIVVIPPWYHSILVGHRSSDDRIDNTLISNIHYVYIFFVVYMWCKICVRSMFSVLSKSTINSIHS